jgi:cell shape-determining protein MreC
LSSRSCKSSRSIALGIVLKIYLIIQIGLSFLKPLLIVILVEFRDYIAILGGLIGILATFTGIMWMFVQQINKRIDTVEKRIADLRDDVDRRFDELREEIKGLREEIKEIRFLLYKVLEVPHK